MIRGHGRNPDALRLGRRDRMFEQLLRLRRAALHTKPVGMLTRQSATLDRGIRHALGITTVMRVLSLLHLSQGHLLPRTTPSKGEIASKQCFPWSLNSSVARESLRYPYGNQGDSKRGNKGDLVDLRCEGAHLLLHLARHAALHPQYDSAQTFVCRGHLPQPARQGLLL
jgi:hypothetical protein